MGWVILGVAIWFVCRKHSTYGCHKHRSRRRPQTRSGSYQRRSESASEVYRMETELEDMNRRMRVMERALHDNDESLRRQFQNL